MNKESLESRITKLEQEIEILKEELKSQKVKAIPSKKVSPLKEKIVPQKEEKIVPKEAPSVTLKKPSIQKEKRIEPAHKPPVKIEKRWLTFERIIGERWLVWVGALVFAAGFGIFLKYAFEQGWVNEISRIALGFLSGFLLLWLAESLFRKRFTALAQGIAALALIILYLTVFTAFHFYKIFPSSITFVLFFLITIGGMTLAMFHNAYPTALLSIFGAFAIPLLLADPTLTVYYEPKLFSYLFIINVGVLYVSSIKKWRALSLLSFICTIIYFGGWYVNEYTPSDFSLAAGFATAYFLLFSFMSTPQSIMGKQKSNWENLVLVILNPFIFFLIAHSMLGDRNLTIILPVVPLVMSIYHFLLAGMIRKINSRDRLLYGGLMGTAIGLLTLPVPMLVKSYWITLAWGVEAIILIVIGGALLNKKPLRIGGFVIFILVTLRLFTIDSFILHYGGDHHFLYINLKFLALFCSSITFGIAIFLLNRLKNITTGEKKYVTPLWTLFITSLFWILNLDLFVYFSHYSGLAGRMEWVYSTVLWSLFFCSLLIYGMLSNNRGLRITGLYLMVATGVKMLLLDTPILYNYYRYGYPFIFNVKFLAVVIFLGCVAASALLYARKLKEGITFKENGLWILWGSFYAILFLSLNFEVFSFFGPMKHIEIRMLRFIITTMLWTGFSCWFIFRGILRDNQKQRITGFILVALSAIKLFLIDTPLLFRYTYGFPFILNWKFLSLALLLGLLAASAKLCVKKGISEEKTTMVPALWTGFVSLLFIGLNVEIISFFSRYEVISYRLESLVFTTILWSCFALFLIFYGMKKNITALRITGFILITFTFLKLIIEDSTLLYSYTYGLPFLLNLKFAAVVVLLYTLAHSAMLFARKREKSNLIERKMAPYLWSLFLILLFIELHSQATFSFYRHWQLGEQRAAFAISLLWVLYGLGILLVGILKKILPLRISALSLFGVTLLKMLFVDLRFTGKLYKMFALLGIGAIFLIAAYFYRKNRQRLMKE